MKQDNQLKEAIEECAKIVEEKCDKRPYMIIIVKTDVGYNSEEDNKKGDTEGNVQLYV
ncbi:hypothetical protein KKD40_06910 [Candidatus Micrarchaeota archaeon]|nr:hypothetical protein [Candidatus Micrarchaeota archaeon]